MTYDQNLLLKVGKTLWFRKRFGIIFWMRNVDDTTLDLVINRYLLMDDRLETRLASNSLNNDFPLLNLN